MDRSGDSSAFLIGFLSNVNGAGGKTRVFDIFIHDELVLIEDGRLARPAGQDARPPSNAAFEDFLG